MGGKYVLKSFNQQKLFFKSTKITKSSKSVEKLDRVNKLINTVYLANPGQSRVSSTNSVGID